MRAKAVSGIMLIVLLFVSMLTLAFNIQPAKAIGIIYIRADGSIDPTTANITTFDNVTYTFTDNIYDEIVVERNNITIDGAGYTLQGTGMGTGTGIDMLDRSNVTIRNVEIEAFYYGIVLWASSNNSIFGNRVTNSTYAGVYLASSSNNTVSSNILTNNTRGVYLDGSFNNTISGNNITANNYFSIYLYYSFNNTVSVNNITNNKYGVYLDGSFNNTISGNNITANNMRGVMLYYSFNNTVSGNKITANNGDGVTLYHSSSNTVSGNNVTNNSHGIDFGLSSNNRFYHNSFIDNTWQVFIGTPGYANSWDDGYPSGGNYWSDHVCTGNPSDGSQPYIIDANNTDHYPFQDPNGWLLPPPDTIPPSIGTPSQEPHPDSVMPNQVVTVSVNVTDDQSGVREVILYYKCSVDGGQTWTPWTYVTMNRINGDTYETEIVGLSAGTRVKYGIIALDNAGYVATNNNAGLYYVYTVISEFPVVTTVDVVPNTLNLKSKGEWITCYIELPEGHNVSAIDIYSIRLNDTFPVSFLFNPPVSVPTEIGDYDNDGILDLMVKFNRTALTSHIYHTLGIEYGNVSLTITGNLTDGTSFEGGDTIKVIFGGDADSSGFIELDDFDIWLDNFGKKPNKCPPGLYPDFNNDGLVDMLDFFVWRENFGATVPPQP